jgi:hypothetical protein
MKIPPMRNFARIGLPLVQCPLRRANGAARCPYKSRRGSRLPATRPGFACRRRRMGYQAFVSRPPSERAVPVVRHNSVGPTLTLTLISHLVSVSSRYRFPGCFRLGSGRGTKAVCSASTRLRNTAAVVHLVTFTACSRGCFPDVSMVKAADPCQRFQFRPVRFRLDRSLRWCVLVKSEMSSILMVVRNEFMAQPSYVRFI